MKKKKIAITIDHPSRELDYLLILIVELIKHGNFQIYLVESYHKKLIYLIDPDIIITPHNRIDYFNLIKFANKKSKLIYYLPAEGGILNKFNLYYKKSIFDSLKFTNAIFCWGKNMYNFLRKNNIHKKKIYLTGTPKSDLLNKKLRKIYNNKKEYTTFVTNFPQINSMYGSEIRDLKNIEMKNDKVRELYFNTNLTIRKKFLEVFNKTVKKFQKQKFILKIHPFEDAKYYKERINFKNVKICHLENIYEILSKSKNLVHFNCQTGFEYFINNNKPISYEFLLNRKEKIFNHKILKKISIKPKNYQEFFKEIIKKKTQSNSESRIINEYFYTDSQLASEKIVKIILKDISKKPKIKSFNKIFFLKQWTVKKFIYFYFSNILSGKIKKFAKYLLNRPNINNNSKNISIQIVNKKLKKINKVLNPNKKINVSKFNYLNLLKIESVLKIN